MFVLVQANTTFWRFPFWSYPGRKHLEQPIARIVLLLVVVSVVASVVIVVQSWTVCGRCDIGTFFIHLVLLLLLLFFFYFLNFITTGVIRRHFSVHSLA